MGSPEARRAPSRGGRPRFAERVGPGAIDLSMTHSREIAAAIAVVFAARG